MGTRGPIPKRSEERVRRNKSDIEIDKIEVSGPVEAPDLGFTPRSDIATELWESVKASGYTAYYEPSDWQVLRFVILNLDNYAANLEAGKPASSKMLAELMAAFSTLLLTEGDRRRLRIEVSRDTNKPSASITDISDYREMFS